VGVSDRGTRAGAVDHRLRLRLMLPVVASIVALGLQSAPGAHADTAARVRAGYPSLVLPGMTGASHVVVDDAHDHVFVSGSASGSPSSAVDVVDFGGSLVASLPMTGGDGMALDPSTNRLYVALDHESTIEVVDTAASPPSVIGTIDTSAAGTLIGTLALSGGRLWFGYGPCATNTAGIASANLANDPPTIKTYTVSGMQFDYCPLVAATASDPNVLLYWDEGLMPPTIVRYDVSTNPPTRVTAQFENGVSFTEGLTFTPDGSHFYFDVSTTPFSVDTLLPDGPSCPGFGSNSTATQAGRFTYVAAQADAEITVGRAKASTCGPWGDFPRPSILDQRVVNHMSMGFSSDAEHLFAAAADYGPGPSYEAVLWTVADPTLSTSSITLQASPPSQSPGQPVELSGALSFTNGHDASAKNVEVTCTGPGSTHTVLDAVTTSGGAYSVQDTETGPAGAYSCDAAYAGDSGHHGSDARATFTIALPIPTLALSASASEIGYNQSVTITANLSAHGTNDVVSIYRTPAGGSQVLVTSAPVDSSGNLSARVTVGRDNAFVASYTGDESYGPVTSSTVVVAVRAGFQGAMVGGYKTMNGFRLYHYTSNCHAHHTGCPTYSTTLLPTDHGGDCVDFQLQYFRSGAWHDDGTTSCFHLNSSSKAAVAFVYNGTSIKGVPFRVRTEFRGDSENAAGLSSWHNFKVTG